MAQMTEMNTPDLLKGNSPQKEPLFFPNSYIIDNIDLEIRKVSSMKCPYNKFSLFNYGSQFNSQFPKEENTEILSINVKVSENEVLMFKVKRFDDLFHTIKLFCEINKINEELINSLIMHVLKSLNQIYQAMNFCLDSKDLMYFELIKPIILKRIDNKT